MIKSFINETNTCMIKIGNISKLYDNWVYLASEMSALEMFGARCSFLLIVCLLLTNVTSYKKPKKPLERKAVVDKNGNFSSSLGGPF